MQCGKFFFQMRSTHAAEFFFHSRRSRNNFLSHQIEKETIQITTSSAANTQIHNATIQYYSSEREGAWSRVQRAHGSETDTKQKEARST